MITYCHKCGEPLSDAAGNFIKPFAVDARLNDVYTGVFKTTPMFRCLTCPQMPFGSLPSLPRASKIIPMPVSPASSASYSSSEPAARPYSCSNCQQQFASEVAKNLHELSCIY